MSESSGIPTPGVYTMGSPVGMEWTTGSPRTLGHSVGGGEEAEHRVTARKGSGTHPLYHQVPRKEPMSLESPALAGGFFTIVPPGKPLIYLLNSIYLSSPIGSVSLENAD